MKNQKKYEKIVFFDDLIILEDDDDTVILGRTEINSYIKVPKISKLVVELLMNNSVEITIEHLKEKNIEIDVEDFIDQLINLNYIHYVNSIEITSLKQEKKTGITFNKIKQYHINWLFNKYFFILSIIYILSAIVLQIIYHKFNFIPSYKEFFWHENILLVVLTVFFLDILLGLMHEFAHFLAGRSLGNQLGYITLGRRLIHLVYQTRIENIWSLPRNKRIIIYASGMIMDLIILSTYIYISIIFQSHEYIYNFSRLIILMLIFGLLFEFRFYMKTDIYFIIADILKKPNLYEDSLNILKRTILFKDVPININIFTVGYSIFMISAGFIDIFLTVYYIIPSLSKIIISTYTSYVSSNYLLLIANILSLLFLIIEYLLIFIFFLRDYVLKRRTSQIGKPR